MTAALLRVVVVAHRLEAQQAVDVDAAQLHEAAVLDHGRDQTLEHLAQAFTQVAALEEAVDRAVGLVGAPLELGELGTERRELGLGVATAAGVARIEHGLQRAVHHEVGVAADRRGEMRVLAEREPEVPDVERLVERLRHGAHHQRLDERPVGRLAEPFGDAAQVARLHLLRQVHLDAERGQRREQRVETLLLGRAVHAVETARTRLLERTRRGDVRQDHALLDELVRLVARVAVDRLHALRGVELVERLGALEIERAAAMTRLEQRLVEVDERRDPRQQRPERLARRRVALEERGIGLVVGEPPMAAHHRRIEAVLEQRAALGDDHVGDEAQTVDLGLERTQMVGERGRQHRQHALREIDRGAALARRRIERRADAHVVAHIGDRHHQAEAARMRFGVDGVVEIACVGAVDGDERHLAQVDAPARLARIHALTVALGLDQRLAREVDRQAVARDGAFTGHLERTVRVELAEHLGGGAVVPVRIADHARDHPVAGPCAVRFAGRHEAAEVQATVDGVHEQRAPHRLEGAEEGADAAREHRLDLAGKAPGRVLAHPHPDTVSGGEPRHLRRRQEDVLLLPFDLHEPET